MNAGKHLRQSPGVTTALVLTIGLAAGGNLAIGSVLDRILVRPPPGITAPTELRRLYLERHLWNGTAFYSEDFSYPDFRDLSRATAGLARIAVYARGDRFLTEAGRFVGVTRADPGLFPILGIHPALGRFFEDEDGSVAVISFRLWNGSLAADPHILGRVLTIEGHGVMVIGVAPRGFAGLDVQPTDVWLPLAAIAGGGESAWRQDQNARFLQAIARLSNSTRGAAGVLDERLVSAFRMAHASDTPYDARVAVVSGPLPRARGPGELLPLEARALSLVERLSAVSLIVLIVATGHCASMLFLRSDRRRRDIEIRVALGLTRARLALELIGELVLLVFASATAAVLIGAWASTALQVALLPATDGSAFALDLRGVFAGAAVGAAAIVVAGIGPALLLLRVAPGDLLRSHATFRFRSRTRTLSIVLQTALSVLLVSIAMHFVASVRRATDVRLGFNVDHLMAIVTGPADQRVVFNVLSLVRARWRAPNIANSTSELPSGMAMTRVALPASAGDSSITISYNAVDTNYFRVIDIRLVRGRTFLPEDDAGSEPVAIISDAMRAAVWRGGDPVGQCMSAFGQCRRIVGVVSDVRWDLTSTPVPHFYLPLGQSPLGFGRVIYVRTDAPATLANLAELEQTLARNTDSIGIRPLVYRVTDRLQPQLEPLRGAAGLLLGYAVLIICAACVGIYGKISYDASQRSRELAVRAALGATRSDLVGLLLGSGMRLVGIGLLLGIVAVTVSASVMARVLFDSTGSEPIIVGSVVSVLCSTAVGAILLAGRRATALDLAHALSSE